jgi:carbohydrate kinase (thermoresistant glucokinase family)
VTKYRAVIVTGVSGAGKTTVGGLLADRLGWEFLDADDFHPPHNREKMAAGVALNDADRAPWLESLARALKERVEAGRCVVLACSALKRAYRDRLRVDPSVRFVHLRVARAALERRLAQRKGHYFRPELLTSQLDALEEPSGAEALVLEDDGAVSPEALASRIVTLLGPGSDRS